MKEKVIRLKSIVCVVLDSSELSNQEAQVLRRLAGLIDCVILDKLTDPEYIISKMVEIKSTLKTKHVKDITSSLYNIIEGHKNG